MSDTHPAIWVLKEWANAIRGSWGGIDGRTCKDQLNRVAQHLIDDDIVDIETIREEAGVCLKGGGHWQEYCEEDWMECPDD